MLGLLKSFIISVYRLFAPLLERLGINPKGTYEIAFWKMAKRKEGELNNAFYEGIFTDLMGLEANYYTNKKILDIGCGPRGSLEWANMAQERVGLDPLVDKYKQLGIDGHEMTYVKAHAEQIPYADAYFDVVTSVNSLDHVDDLEKTLAEVARVTAPNGEFIVMTHIHDKPTIAEPTSVPWNLTSLLNNHFDVIEEHHYEVSTENASVTAGLREKIPFNHDNPTARYGIIFARLQRK